MCRGNQVREPSSPPKRTRNPAKPDDIGLEGRDLSIKMIPCACLDHRPALGPGDNGQVEDPHDVSSFESGCGDMQQAKWNHHSIRSDQRGHIDQQDTHQ